MVYIFKMVELISIISSILQRHFILHISVDSMLIKYIIQSGNPAAPVAAAVATRVAAIGPVAATRVDRLR